MRCLKSPHETSEISVVAMQCKQTQERDKKWLMRVVMARDAGVDPTLLLNPGLNKPSSL
jgi:hypothetical protein